MRLNQLSYLLGLILSSTLIFTNQAGVLGQTKKEESPIAQAKKDDQVKLRTDMVSLIVSVTDSYGRSVIGLKNEHFKVLEDKIEQKVELFSDNDVPVSIGVIYDTSGSMKEKLGNSSKALTTFFETGHDDDDIFLMTFNDHAKLAHDFTTSHQEILSNLMFAQSNGSTALYDGIYLGVEKIQQGHHAKKALLVISDGQDNASRYTYQELRNRVKEADVIIYAIGVILDTDPLVAQGRAILEELARMTGGRAFFPSFFSTSNANPELQEIVTRVALELRHQYALGYYPTNNKRDGKWRKIQVKINAPKGVGRLFVSTKEGYYALKD